jgi:serine phosphatase RsbU (regulator of sigma subunit)
MLIKEKPAILQDPVELKLIRKKLDVDELHVSDKSGRLIVSLRQKSFHGKDSYDSYNLAKEEQSRVFMKAITDPDFELVQEPQYNGAERRLFQYTGVARLDAPGVVQVGYQPNRIKRARQLADVKNIEADMRIGINGKLFIKENALYPANHKRIFYTREGLCQSVVYGKYLLTAMLPWQEVYKKDRTVITTLLAGNLIVFGLIFFMITGLLQRVVIKEISAVTDSLDELSKGNFDKTINVNSSEMHALAESINKTVDTLKKQNVPARAETETEITGMLKNSMLPVAIPENENFKFTADIFTSDEFGGNLCDFFQIDKEHIALFFADAAEKGIAAGLYAIKAKNMLRKALLKHSPGKALKIVNDELFYQEKTKLSLRIFLGVLNLRSGVLLIFNSGHVDPVIKSAGGQVKFVKGPFMPLLGASSETFFTALPLQMYSGDKLIFYSGDMIEAENSSGEKYGTDRLRDIISSYAHNEAKDAVDAISRSITEFTGASSLDVDIAVAILEYTPADSL